MKVLEFDSPASRLIYSQVTTFSAGQTLKEMHEIATTALLKICDTCEGLNLTVQADNLISVLGILEVSAKLEQAGCKLFVDIVSFKTHEQCLAQVSCLQNIPNLRIVSAHASLKPKTVKVMSEILPNTAIALSKIPADHTEQELKERFGRGRVAIFNKFFNRFFKDEGDQLQDTAIVCMPGDIAAASQDFRKIHPIITPLDHCKTKPVDYINTAIALLAGADMLLVTHSAMSRRDLETHLDIIKDIQRVINLIEKLGQAS
jgi:hypothetical protein